MVLLPTGMATTGLGTAPCSPVWCNMALSSMAWPSMDWHSLPWRGLAQHGQHGSAQCGLAWHKFSSAHRMTWPSPVLPSFWCQGNHCDPNGCHQLWGSFSLCVCLQLGNLHPFYLTAKAGIQLFP